MENSGDVLKICKIHGSLTRELITFRKPPRTEKACKLCNREKKKQERLKNPEKFRNLTEKRRYIERDPNIKEIRCARCKITKSVDKFNKYMLKIRCAYCIDCRRTSTAKNRARPEAKQKHKDWYIQKYEPTAENNRLQKLYGISLDEYEEMLEKQNYLCAICHQPEQKKRKGRPYRLGIDHCHETGTIRGLLCWRCNCAFGKLRDDPGIIKSALEYGIKHNRFEQK